MISAPPREPDIILNPRQASTKISIVMKEFIMTRFGFIPNGVDASSLEGLIYTAMIDSQAEQKRERAEERDPRKDKK